jgi:hypothetical protein
LKPKLSTFKKNIHSQFGEDGIIEKIFSLIGTTNKICIEFGAWDGFHLSNSANLWSNGWRGILIECEADRALALHKLKEKYDVVPITGKVGVDHATDSIEKILADNQIEVSKPDFLSIDIDGDDYHVFASLQKLRPRVIVCEYNPTMPSFADMVPKLGNYLGCSLLAITKLAEKMGYTLVATTEVNAFFVENSLSEHFKEFELDVQNLYLTEYYNYVVTTYDGRYMTYGDFCYGIRAEDTEELLIDNLSSKRKSIVAICNRSDRPDDLKALGLIPSLEAERQHHNNRLATLMHEREIHSTSIIVALRQLGFVISKKLKSFLLTKTH